VGFKWGSVALVINHFDIDDIQMTCRTIEFNDVVGGDWFTFIHSYYSIFLLLHLQTIVEGIFIAELLSLIVDQIDCV
jgi:hypothetical protein